MKTIEDLTRLLETNRGKRHIIVLQDFPDPDAISSALAHQLISAHFGVETDIVYSGKISHQQNIALVKLLRIELIPFTEELDLAQYGGAVFVDNQGTTAEKIVKELEENGVPFLIIVDHHEDQRRVEVEFSDIRLDVGATATIYSQYLESGFIQMDKTIREHCKVTTALMHGIITDTSNFIRATPSDFHASAFLSRFTDADLLTQILSQARSKQTMEMIQRALGNRHIAESVSIAGIGYLRADNRDAIPQAADFLLTEENVHTAIVYGIVSGDGWDESLMGSMRTTKITINPDEFIKEVFGKDANGNYFGGGKTSAGAFNIPIGFLSGVGSQEFMELKWKVYTDKIKQRILAKISNE